MKIDSFAQAGSAVKFTTIGDRVAGTISDEPQLVPDKYTVGGQVLVLALNDDGDDRRLFARRQLLQAIGDAVIEAGTDEIECGGFLEVEYVADKPAGAGMNPMKVYRAQYVPPSALGRATVGAESDGTW